MVGAVSFGVLAMVAVATSPTTAGCGVVWCGVVVVVVAWWSCSCGVV